MPISFLRDYSWQQCEAHFRSPKRCPFVGIQRAPPTHPIREHPWSKPWVPHQFRTLVPLPKGKSKRILAEKQREHERRTFQKRVPKKSKSACIPPKQKLLTRVVQQHHAAQEAARTLQNVNHLPHTWTREKHEEERKKAEAATKEALRKSRKYMN